MSLAQFIVGNSKRIIAEWAEFARVYIPAASLMDIEERRDHVEGMLKQIALDLDTPQTRREQTKKSKGKADAHVDSTTAANSHGTDRAAHGYSAMQMVSEFRALRASVLRMWSETQSECDQASLDDVTRFNEAIDQLLAESVATYVQGVDQATNLFLGVLGHDLRNPLGAIMMSISAMMHKEGPDWSHLKSASRILSSSVRMNALISDLADFTRSQLGTGIPINRADMDMETICRQVVEEITAFHPGCVVHFKASGHLRGYWDSGRMGQLLSNLVANANQHGSKNCPIEVVLRGETDAVTLTVHNKGRLIAKRNLKDIFDPFRQLDPARGNSNNPSSVGLGLYIVQAIVVAHRGRIDVESSTHGTTFTIHLPHTVPSSP